MNTKVLITLSLLPLGILLSACQTTGGEANISNYSLAAPSDRSLSAKEVADSAPQSFTEVLKPIKSLARGAKVSVTTASLKQPLNPRNGSQITLGKEGLVVTTGPSHQNTESDKSLAHMRYYGAGLIVMGAVLLAAKFKFPIIPIHLGVAVLASGFVIAALPEFVAISQTVLNVILIVGIIGLIAYLILSYLRSQRSESTLSVLVNSIKELENSDDAEKQRQADTLKAILSKRMGIAEKEKVDQVKAENRRKAA